MKSQLSVAETIVVVGFLALMATGASAAWPYLTALFWLAVVVAWLSCLPPSAHPSFDETTEPDDMETSQLWNLTGRSRRSRTNPFDDGNPSNEAD